MKCLAFDLNPWFSYRKTHLYLSTKLAFWEIQLPGYVKRRNRPFSSFLTNLSGLVLFPGPSLWTVNLSGPIFMNKATNLADSCNTDCGVDKQRLLTTCYWFYSWFSCGTFSSFNFIKAIMTHWAYYETNHLTNVKPFVVNFVCIIIFL